MFATVTVPAESVAQPVGGQHDALLLTAGPAAQADRPVTQSSYAPWSGALDRDVPYYPDFDDANGAHGGGNIRPESSY